MGITESRAQPWDLLADVEWRTRSMKGEQLGRWEARVLEDCVHRVAMTEDFDKSCIGVGERSYTRFHVA